MSKYFTYCYLVPILHCSSACHFYLVRCGNNISQLCSHSTNIHLTFIISGPVLGAGWVFGQTKENGRERENDNLEN